MITKPIRVGFVGESSKQPTKKTNEQLFGLIWFDSSFGHALRGNNKYKM